MNIPIIELIFDYSVIAFTLLIVILSFWKGFINSVLGLLTWLGSAFITIYTYNFFILSFKSFLNIEFLSGFEQIVTVVSIIISIPIIFLLSLFILKRIRKILSSDLDKQILGLILDKFFGIIYGIIFSYVIFSTILYFTSNNSLSILNNINSFLVENSNILNQVSLYNENMINIYNSNIEE